MSTEEIRSSQTSAASSSDGDAGSGDDMRGGRPKDGKDPALWRDSLGEGVRPGDVVADKYRLDAIIAIGGMGVIIAAEHLGLRERVVVKVLPHALVKSDEARGRFDREARMAIKIQSDHVARVIDVGTLGDMPYIVMEYLEGSDLGDLLTARTPVAVADAVEYVIQACEAVAQAHSQGIVHRDIKPENLFLTRRGDGTPCVKVLDFGLSKVMDESKDSRERSPTLTNMGQVMGTPEYMCPEQWMSAKNVGPEADQWALGVILYELLTNEQPFSRPHMAQLCAAVLNDDPDPIRPQRPEVPEDLEAVVMRTLAKRPYERYPNVAELVVDLLPFAPPRCRPLAKRIVEAFTGPMTVQPASAQPISGHAATSDDVTTTYVRPPPRPEPEAQPGRDDVTVQLADLRALPPPPDDDMAKTQLVKAPVPPPPPAHFAASAPAHSPQRQSVPAPAPAHHDGIQRVTVPPPPSDHTWLQLLEPPPPRTRSTALIAALIVGAILLTVVAAIALSTGPESGGRMPATACPDAPV